MPNTVGMYVLMQTIHGTVNLSYEELAYYENRTRYAYEKMGAVGFDKDEWEKIKYAIDGVLEKTI